MIDSPIRQPSRSADSTADNGQTDLYKVLLRVRNLLEEYAPSWYPDDLRKEVEAVLRLTGKQ